MASHGSSFQKVFMGAAGSGAGLDVDEVFSTYLYDGTGANQTITNNIDLSGEGGLVWFKVRTTTGSHTLFDTERGTTKYVSSNSADAEATQTTSLTSFNNNGFSIGSLGEVNENNQDFVSWTFRKAPKFFDIVTYTGDGTNNRQIAHNLGAVPGCIIIKMRSGQKDWKVYHRGIDSSNPENYKIHLNETAARSDGSTLFDAPTDTHFVLDSNDDVNGNGDTHVAYLFAHNNNDGEFGPDGDADIIKCGSYSGNGSTTGPVIDLGFEPQWVMIKNTSSAGDWTIFDSLRGVETGGNDSRLHPNTTQAESDSADIIDFNSTGFQLTNVFGDYNASGDSYIYMAIRRGSLAPPEAATDVFAVSVTDYSANQTIAANIDVTDTFMVGHQPTNNNSNGLFLFSRLTGNKRLRTDQAFAENAESGLSGFDTMNGVVAGSSDSGQNVWNASFPFIKYFMKRAPNYFDVVAYNGDATASPNSRNINHNLGVAPEMMWIKCRSAGENWAVYHSGIGAAKYMNLNNTNAIATSANWWRNTAPTDTVFTIGHQDDVNLNGGTHIAYLFASLDGISKVGSATHSGTTNVDCGFSSGARFVLLKRTDAASDWYFWDTTRGIVSGNDPYLTLNGTNQAEITNTDYIDPLSSGFTITSSLTAGDYIFYAIA